MSNTKSKPKKSRTEYQKEYQAANREKIVMAQLRYWIRQAEKFNKERKINI